MSPLEKALRGIAGGFSPAVLAHSLQAEDMVLTDVIARAHLPIGVFVLDRVYDPMPRGLPSAIASGMWVFGGLGLGVTSTIAFASPSDSAVDFKGVAAGTFIGSIAGAAECALRLGDVALATRLMTRSASGTLAAVMVRLDPALLALADEPEFAPRRLDRTLLWPLEAPMIDAARFRMFRDMKVESALPER